MRPQFTYSPTVPFLQLLVPGSLKQNLPKTVRLWVILRSLYGEDGDEVRLNLREQFTFEEWRNQFFTQADPNCKEHHSEKVYHKRDEIPPLHDPDCHCAKTLSDWLFDKNSSLTISKEKWQESFLQIYPTMTKAQLEPFLASGNFAGTVAVPQKWQPKYKAVKASSKRPSKATNTYVPPFPNGRLFGVTGKNLEFDFKTLIEMGWLEVADSKGASKKHYQKVKKYPPLDSFNLNTTTANFISQPDFSEIADNYFQPINGIQRFFMHVDYVVSKEAIDKIRVWQDELKRMWEKTPIPPTSIVYESASLSRQGKRIVYPVCIYYFQRAPYLCAFGQQPKHKEIINWYNYRLDRIQSLEELSWDREQVPDQLKQKCLHQQPPLPEDIQVKMAQAWGFDFYQPSHKMLLRFERDFHTRHIAKTFRHDTFTFLDTQDKFRKFIREYAPNKLEKQQLEEILHSLPVQADDIGNPYAYYSADYRIDEFNLIDNNVMMRLRAWGPKVEILLPGDLRERMAKDIQETWKLYCSEIQ